MNRIVLITLLMLISNVQYAQDGDFLVVDRFSIEGNRVTKENIILRELTFAIGDTIPKRQIFSELATSRNNLQNTLLFNFVYMDFMPEGDRIEVRIRVVERWYIWPIPIFEHAERNLPSWLRDPEFERLNYGAWLNWNNFRGRREMLQLKVRLGYKEQYALTYSKPNLDKDQKHGIEVSLNSFRQREVILETVGNEPVFLEDDGDYLSTSINPVISYTYRPGLYLRHRATLGYNYLLFGADSVREEYLGGTKDWMDWFSIAYSLSYDNRDYQIYPLDGNFFRISLLRRGLGIISDFDYGKSYLTLVGSHHRKIIDRLYYENAMKLRLTNDEDLPYLFRQALGFDTFLRGFEYYLIDGNSYIISANNLKYNLLPKKTFNLPLIPWEQFNKIHFSLYSNLFFDFAYVDGNFFNVNGNDLTNKFLFSTGLGFDLLSYYDQVYRLEFTLNSLGEFGVFLHLETPFRRW
jgi:outer membrane protein assembly factor BamA